MHLASIAKVGAKVTVLQSYPGGVSETAPLSSLFDSSLWGSEPAPAPKKAAPKKPVAAKQTAVPAAAEKK